MATKTEMIEYIIQNSDNNQNDLEELSYNSVKKIFNTIEVIDTPDEFIIEGDNEEEVEESKETVSKTFTIEVGNMTEDEIKAALKEITDKLHEEHIVIEEVEEVDFFTLSPAQRRAYQRSGIIPKKK